MLFRNQPIGSPRARCWRWRMLSFNSMYAMAGRIPRTTMSRLDLASAVEEEEADGIEVEQEALAAVRGVPAEAGPLGSTGAACKSTC